MKLTPFYFVAHLGGKGVNARVVDNEDGSASVQTYPGGVSLPVDPDTLIVETMGRVHGAAVKAGYQRSDHLNLKRLAGHAPKPRNGEMTLSEFLTTGPLVKDSDLGLALIDGLKVSLNS